ncbi:hypothetical protein MUK42_31976 [Musa troglodytarum]|uniref:DUF7725 domain-containing protein n=1 Tax=Musa troglodytarum TaxID=320322 RepID=A0A9E7LG52_9LILI|nr:hypothetical protein MUK42_31976 [Musa troglodytarum]
MEAPSGLGGAVPVPASQAAKKEWRAIPEHSFRSNGSEEQEHVKLGQSAERTIHEVGTGSRVDYCAITIDADDASRMQKLQEIMRQREELQQMEIELQARAIARSEILEVQNSFEVQLKEHMNINADLKEQLHEREQSILELERKLEEKDRELRAMKIDTEAAWAKEDLLREQNKELATFRRELDNSEAERAQHLSQIRDLQKHIQEKESNPCIAGGVARETILFKDEQLREAQSWVARVQEMDALQSSTNQSLQAELRERTEQFNQYWIGFQRQFVEMEHHHLQAIQQLQLELAEARKRMEIMKMINVIDGGKSNGHLGFASNGSVDGTSSHVLSSSSSSKIEHAPSVPVVPSSMLGMNAFMPPGPVAALHPYVMNPLGVPQAVASSNSPIPQSHIDHFQSMPVVLTQQHLQNQQALSDISQIPESKHPPSQTEQEFLRSDTHYSFDMPGEMQMVHLDNLNSHRDQQQMSGHPGFDSSDEIQVLQSNVKQHPVIQESQGTSDAPSHLDSARGFVPPEKNATKAEDIVAAGKQSQEQVPRSGQQQPTSNIMLSASQNSISSDESVVLAAPISSTLMSSKPPVDPNLLDERSLLACIVRAVPAGSDGRIRISATLPNRLGKMLAPLHWHDYKKHYGKLDDFVARHPELFVIEGDFIHLREGAQQIISATTAVAKVAAATASSAPYTSLLPSVAVTPVSQVNRQKKVQSIESKTANTMPYADGAAVINAGDSSDKRTQILMRQDEQPNGVRLNIIQGLSDVTVSSKSKNIQEANGSQSEIKSGHSSLYFKVGNAANLDRTGLSPPQNKGLTNGRHSYGGKQQGSPNKITHFSSEIKKVIASETTASAMGFLLRVRLASFFAGAATASLAGFYLLSKDYLLAHDAVARQVAPPCPPLHFFRSLFLDVKGVYESLDGRYEALNKHVTALENWKETQAAKPAEASD